MARWGGVIALLACGAAAGIASAQVTASPTTFPSTSSLSIDRIPSTAASTAPAVPASTGLAGMSLDQLLNTQVTLVSRTPERLGESASSIQVITNEEIRRSGAVSLPEALRLATNLQVAQINAHDWAISSRGFNGAPLPNNGLSDKLLVMIDGRTVYSPLFGGVFWDVQNVLLEDVDRIEVVSGPGGTLWGSNAVNGVINVVTKSAKDTQGLYLSGLGGTFWHDYGAVRYGGQINDNTYYRVYGLGFQHENTFYPDGEDVNDEWKLAQSGFRIDSYPTQDNTLTLQGDIYGGQDGSGNFYNPTGAPGPDFERMSGGNVLGRWTHVFSKKSDLTVQAYFDGQWRDLPLKDFGYGIRTYDIDVQHRFPLGESQSITWGGGYRLIQDSMNNDTALSLLPADQTLNLYNIFVQDEITLVPDTLKLTLGSKFEHNDYSGYEIEPSGRLAWTLNDRNTIWAAISRAVRSPTRLDADTLTPALVSPDSFQSEKLTAYELGYRVRPVEPLSLSIASFYNNYQDLRSFDTNAGGARPLTFGNNQQAGSWGRVLGRLPGSALVAIAWRLHVL